MALFSVPNVQLKGLAVSVPANTEDNMQLELFTQPERELFVKTVGIRYRRVAAKEVTAADLCFSAANKLLTEMNWQRHEVSVLIFITQTPDYIIPNTSSLLQEKLGLSKSCLVFDVNLGCSGYVYGLSVISSLLQNIPNGKGLLLVGDVSTAVISKNDRSTTPLFSDAGSATALVNTGAGVMHFNLQTDGKEYDDIIVPDGGFRNKTNTESFIEREVEKGICRSNLDMKLDGVKIFNFALREVAPNVNALLQTYSIAKEDIDCFVMHQANLLMLESVRKKLQVPAEKFPYSLYHFGNTSSATIPLTMLVKENRKLSSEKAKWLLSGFGVGLSWGSVYLETENVTCLPLIEIK
ncbi:MAG: ketoacyl-ACP synthase III [Chitinophagales bacterium]|nr:ketoacyl-ACP synthase III [Chitinophagales bacterium]